MLHAIDLSVIRLHQTTRNGGQCPRWWPPFRI